MSRTTRLFILMQTLRRHRFPVSGHSLAAELGISLRTLYRDIAELKALGADIDGESGVGYVLKPGFLLPPLMFSEAEIEALALGLKWVTLRAGGELAESAAQAQARLAAVLPGELRHRMDDSPLLVGPGASQSSAVDLSLLHRATREERKLRIEYLDADRKPTQRTLWPCVIAFFESVCMVAAWCELREDFRHFRVDRIVSAEILDEHYPRRRHTLHKAWRNTLKHRRRDC